MERALHETWESYSYRLNNAVKVAYPEASKETNAKMVATRLFEAFPPEIKTQILMRDLSSLPEILRTAQLMESCSALTADTKPQTGDLAPFTPDGSSANVSRKIQNKPSPSRSFRGNTPRQGGGWKARANTSESDTGPEPTWRGS